MGKPYAIPAKAIKVNFMTKSYRDSPLSTSQMGSMEVVYKQACSQTQSVYVFRYRLFFLTGPPLKSQVFETTESKNFLDSNFFQHWSLPSNNRVQEFLGFYFFQHWSPHEITKSKKILGLYFGSNCPSPLNKQQSQRKR